MAEVQEILVRNTMEVDDDTERVFRQCKGIRGPGYGRCCGVGQCRGLCAHACHGWKNGRLYYGWAINPWKLQVEPMGLHPHAPPL